MKNNLLHDLFKDASYPAMLLGDKGDPWVNDAFKNLPDEEQKTTRQWAEAQTLPCSMQTRLHYYDLLPAQDQRLVLASPRFDHADQKTLCTGLINTLDEGGNPWLSAVQLLGPMLGWSHVAAIMHKNDENDELIGHWHKGDLEAPRTLPITPGSLAARLYSASNDQILVHHPCERYPEDPLINQKKHSFWLGQLVSNADGPHAGYLCCWGKPDSDQLQQARSLLTLSADLISAFVATRRKTSIAHVNTRHLPTDPLTQLPGRKAFDMTLESFEQRYLQTQEDCLMAMLDINGLSAINTERGVEFGDQLLRELGQEFNKRYSDNGRVFRFAGDEFVILQPFGNKEPSLTKDLGEIEKKLAEKFELEEFSLAAGIAKLSDSKGSSDDLMLMCDKRLHDAKSTA